MMRCNEKCDITGKNICCYDCAFMKECEMVCDEQVPTCPCLKFDEETSLEIFRRQELEVMKSIAALCEQKKRLEAEEKALRDKLKQAMELYNVKSFKCDWLKLTYVAEGTSTQLDTAKVKKLHPDIASECSKPVKKSAYVKIEVEGGKK